MEPRHSEKKKKNTTTTTTTNKKKRKNALRDSRMVTPNTLGSLNRKKKYIFKRTYPIAPLVGSGTRTAPSYVQSLKKEHNPSNSRPFVGGLVDYISACRTRLSWAVLNMESFQRQKPEPRMPAKCGKSIREDETLASPRNCRYSTELIFRHGGGR